MLSQHHRPSTLSRTSSTTSTDSASDRRTRKRFNDGQLMLLDQLFHQTSHPTRDQRDALAKAGRMESKSVTIWFQNKRQTERRGGLSLSTNHHSQSSAHHPHAHASHHNHNHSNATSNGNTPAHAHPYTRPSLDAIASRRPSTPPRPSPYTISPRSGSVDASKHAQALWDTMPSSPGSPPSLPHSLSHSYSHSDFGFGFGFGVGNRKLTRTRTLEWACARSRLGAKEKERENAKAKENNNHSHKHNYRQNQLDAEERVVTDMDMDMGRMPPPPAGLTRAATWSAGDAWTQQAPPDDDMLGAALALCGLGRGL